MYSAGQLSVDVLWCIEIHFYNSICLVILFINVLKRIICEFQIEKEYW